MRDDRIRLLEHGLDAAQQAGLASGTTKRQLAHHEPNEIRAAYNYAKHLPEQRKMMQAWVEITWTGFAAQSQECARRLRKVPEVERRLC